MKQRLKTTTAGVAELSSWLADREDPRLRDQTRWVG